MAGFNLYTTEPKKHKEHGTDMYIHGIEQRTQKQPAAAS